MIVFTAPSTRRGFTFVGWSPSEITTDITGNVTVRTIWLQNTYSVRFDANGGTGAMADQNFAYGFRQYLAETNVTRNGYAFAGWSTTKNGTAESPNGVVSLDDGAMPFSSANVDITFGVPEDGKVKFTAGPKDAGAKTFFMKVRVK